MQSAARGGRRARAAAAPAMRTAPVTPGGLRAIRQRAMRSDGDRASAALAAVLVLLRALWSAGAPGEAPRGVELPDQRVAGSALASAADAASDPTAESAPRPLYDLAGAHYGVSPSLLRALHTVESSAASDGCWPNLEGSGAIGPLQFMPSTFRAYGVDADGDGRADVCGFADSLYSAARYLRVLGADADPASPSSRRALKRYGTEVERVLALAGG